jgi:hypothetical protein
MWGWSVADPRLFRYGGQLFERCHECDNCSNPESCPLAPDDPVPDPAPRPVRELPLLVSGPLVRAILDGRKTVTRRLPRNPGGWLLSPRGPTMLSCYQPSAPHDYAERDIDAPYAVGDVLWVRETWCYVSEPHQPGGAAYLYRADNNEATRVIDNARGWKPSIHMPRAAARIFLRVESVTVELVQDITEESARAEGIDEHPACEQALILGCSYREAFRLVWDSLAPAGSKWADNPWVWVIGFRRVAGVDRA